MSDISVALTTTKYIAATEGPVEVIGMNLPMCAASMGMHGFGIDEQFEHMISQACLDMAKVVVVDSEKKTIFIGKDINSEESALVIYREEKDTEFDREFFRRWNETKTLLLEFGVTGKSFSFSIHGLWNMGKWTYLEVGSEPKWHIVKKE